MSNGSLVAVLASGSSGNATLFWSEGSGLLVDAGLSVAELRYRLGRVGAGLDQLDGVVLTHLHGDHTNPSVLNACSRLDIPVYAPPNAVPLLVGENSWAQTSGFCRVLRALDSPPMRVGKFSITWFTVPHDSPGETVGLGVTCPTEQGPRRVVLATDLGHMPDYLLPHFDDADVLILEANHDERMLWESDRPYWLKSRIASPRGHLSNAQAAAALKRILSRRVRPPAAIVLAHLSQECNTPETALTHVRRVLDSDPSAPLQIVAADQFEPVVLELG